MKASTSLSLPDQAEEAAASDSHSKTNTFDSRFGNLVKDIVLDASDADVKSDNHGGRRITPRLETSLGSLDIPLDLKIKVISAERKATQTKPAEILLGTSANIFPATHVSGTGPQVQRPNL